MFGCSFGSTVGLYQTIVAYQKRLGYESQHLQRAPCHHDAIAKETESSEQ